MIKGMFKDLMNWVSRVFITGMGLFMAYTMYSHMEFDEADADSSNLDDYMQVIHRFLKHEGEGKPTKHSSTMEEGSTDCSGGHHGEEVVGLCSSNTRIASTAFMGEIELFVIEKVFV